MFGVLVKQHALGQSADQADWLVGAELLADDVKGVALRSMAAPGTAYDDPRLGKDPQPAHLRDYVETTDDNGGVHINSGIPNKAFHVLATTLGGNAWEVAGQVWVDTITGDISADCDFATFAALTITAAGARHGADSEVATAVRAAWQASASPRARPPRTTPDGGDTGAGAPSAPGPSTAVSVRRTGGFAGRTLERTVVLDELPNGDTRAWQSLLADDSLTVIAREAAATRRMPDAFCYGVRCETPPLDVELPEPQLSDDVRGLFERTLSPGEG